VNVLTVKVVVVYGTKETVDEAEDDNKEDVESKISFGVLTEAAKVLPVCAGAEATDETRIEDLENIIAGVFSWSFSGQV